ncbi:Gfo/Idh/MocA family oxidoreductase [Agromyces mediolanus]|nr:Gfo/Idh/MocA family oxidoreductase [Agromyces mediolanus]
MTLERQDMYSPRARARTVALLGAGGIANAHLPVWLELGFDVLVYSPAADAPALVARHGGGTVAPSLDAALDAASLVDICTPTPTHHELAAAALARGLPTICEKPLTRHASDARQLVQDFAEAGIVLFPAHVVRYFPQYEALHAAISRGDIGRPGVVRLTRQGGSPRSGWYLDDELSGGVVLDLMIHDLDIARWIAGDVTKVFARTHRVGASQSTQALLTHESGAISQLTSTWTTAPIEFRTQVEVAGTEGLIRADSDERRTFRYVGIRQPEYDILPPYDPVTSPYRAEILDFLSAVDTGAPSRVTAQDGLEALRIAEAIAASVADGRSHELSPTPTLEGVAL